MVSSIREVNAINLRHTGGNPMGHRARAAHARSRVPEGATVGLARGTLRGDNSIDAGDHFPYAAVARPAIAGPNREDGSGGGGGPKVLEQRGIKRPLTGWL